MPHLHTDIMVEVDMLVIIEAMEEVIPIVVIEKEITEDIHAEEAIHEKIDDRHNSIHEVQYRTS